MRDNRVIGSAMIGLSGFVFMINALWCISDLDVTPHIAHHLLFIFGVILVCFGLFTLPDEYK